MDKYIWDKGEPQSYRQKGEVFPLYRYPIPCYEEIIIFTKRVLDKDKPECPYCHAKILGSNSQVEGIGIQGWECQNKACPHKSKNGRGYRFSKRSLLMQSYKSKGNQISDGDKEKWRRNILSFPPVIKTHRGNLDIKHPAPFPPQIPELAITQYSGINDLVYDPFMGSGTTAVVALHLKRNFIGSEISKVYCDIAEKRLAEATEKLSFSDESTKTI